MSELSELIRKSYVTTRPATPPAGQWEAVEERLERYYANGKVAAKRSGPFPTKRLAIAGLILLLFVLYRFRNKPTSHATHRGFPLTESVPSGVPIDAKSSTFVPPTSTQPDVVGERSKPTNIKTVVANAETGNNVSFGLPVRKNSNGTPGTKAGRILPLPVTTFQVVRSPFPNILDRVKSPILTKKGRDAYHSLHGPLFYTPPILRTAEAAALSDISPDRFRAVPTTAPPVHKEKGRWEIGLHLTPWLTESAGATQAVYRPYQPVSSPGQAPRTAVLASGESINLYRHDDFVGLALRQRPILAVAHAEIARQWNSGWRISLGITHFNFPGRTYDPNQRHLAADEYALFSRYENRNWIPTLGLQYTINRRHRLNFSVGVIWGGLLLSRERQTEYFIGGPDRALHPQSTRLTQNANFLAQVLPPLPQLGLHYRLNAKVSVGLELVPGIGVGGRYSW